MKNDTKIPALLIQFESRLDLSLPWPVRVNVAGEVTDGRPDAWNLIGFQKYKHVQHLDLTLDDAIGSLPESQAVGMYPVYSASDGSGIFVVLEKVATFEVVGGPES